VEPARTYRTRLSLRIAVALAAAFWAGMAVLLARAGSPPAAVLGAAGFAAFFAASLLVYERSSITVTGDGIVAASPLRRTLVPFAEILQIVVRDGPGGRAYAILTRRGLFRFTSLFGRHRELFELLLDRSELAPRRI
jgi:hypothetical protein